MLTAAWRELRFHRDWPCLLCLVCNRWSYNPTDIQQRYCQWCHLFLDELPEDYGRAAPVAPVPPAHAWERPARPAARQPWDKAVPPAIAACGLCDDHGMVDMLTPDGTGLVVRCCHDPGAMQYFAAQHGYQLVREDRSREPPALPQEGGPAP